MAGELTFSGQVTAAKGRVWEASELETRRAMMRNTLENLRVGPGHRVAVAIGEDVGFMTAVAAIRDTGAVAALISSRPAGALRDAPRVRELLVDAVPDVTILDDAHGKAFSNLPGAIIRVAPSGELAVEGTPPVDGPRAPVDAALLIYTSGTEGPGKGVLISARALETLLAVNRGVNAWSSAEVPLLGLPLTHLAGFLNFAGSVGSEARAVISPDWMWSAQVMEACLAHRVTVLPIVPYHLSLLLRQPRFGELTSLRLVVQSTAPIVRTDIEQLLAIHPNVKVVNAYGLTEAFRSTVLAPSEVPARLPSIGRPVEGVEVELRDEAGAPVIGAGRGTAWIRGGNVMMGYWNQPAETARVLHEGWFCTQDLLRRDDDGFLFVEGRLRESINGGGEKLSPEVIETYVLEHCPVSEVAVIGVDVGKGFDEVIAFVSPRADQVVTLADVRAACARRVHSVFLPSRLITTRSLPRNATGKVDRLALRRQLEAS